MVRLPRGDSGSARLGAFVLRVAAAHQKLQGAGCFVALQRASPMAAKGASAEAHSNCMWQLRSLSNSYKARFKG